VLIHPFLKPFLGNRSLEMEPEFRREADRKVTLLELVVGHCSKIRMGVLFDDFADVALLTRGV
jgi:hypothetical protein